MMRKHPFAGRQRAGATGHLNQRDLAARWGVSTRTLERQRWLNQGPAYLKIGSRVAYRLIDIEAYEAAHLRQGGR